MRSFDYDVIVIGGGGAGLTAAKTCRGLGKKVALIEKDKLGGECTWTGCVPSKTVIHAADVAYKTTHLNAVGLQAEQTITLATDGVMAHVQKTVHAIYSTHTPEKIHELGISVLFGAPRFIDKHTVELGSSPFVVSEGRSPKSNPYERSHPFDSGPEGLLSGRTALTAKKFIICTGSRPFVPPLEGLDTVEYLTNHTLFALKELPKSMIIVGGGPIGCEIASALNRLGVTVTVIEMQERLLQHEDAELVALLTKQLQKEGVHIATHTAVTKVENNNGAVRVTANQQGKHVQFDAEKLLIAAGRQPNIEDLNLEAAGIKTNKQGIVVDATMQTTAKNIYAAGDVVGPYLFSHMAYYQAAIAARNACIPLFKKKADYTHVSWATFTAPPLANAGLTEEQARKQYGNALRIYRYDYNKLDRAHNDDAPFGLVKIICDTNNKIVGAHIVGERADELIGLVQLGKTYAMPFDKLYHVIYPYPTYNEAVWHAAHQAYIKKLEQNVFLKMLKRFLL